MGDKEDKTVRQYVLFCRTALMYEKKNYYNERKHRAESGNVTEQVVDVSKADPKNCDTAEMYAYTANLKESEKGSFERKGIPWAWHEQEKDSRHRQHDIIFFQYTES